MSWYAWNAPFESNFATRSAMKSCKNLFPFLLKARPGTLSGRYSSFCMICCYIWSTESIWFLFCSTGTCCCGAPSCSVTKPCLCSHQCTKIMFFCRAVRLLYLSVSKIESSISTDALAICCFSCS